MAEILSTRHNTAKNQSIKPSGQYFSQITVFIGSLLSDGQLFFTCTIKPLWSHMIDSWSVCVHQISISNIHRLKFPLLFIFFNKCKTLGGFLSWKPQLISFYFLIESGENIFNESQLTSIIYRFLSNILNVSRTIILIKNKKILPKGTPRRSIGTCFNEISGKYFFQNQPAGELLLHAVWIALHVV